MLKLFKDLNKDKYDQSDIEIFDKNPHVEQLYFLGKTPKFDIPFKRTLLDSDPRQEYHTFEEMIKLANPNMDISVKSNDKTVVHWGQRKLLLSEIEFLTNYSTSGQIVVYVGAAPGTHIYYLSTLFPRLTFHLYDPVRFVIRENKQIKIFQQLFEKEDALKYKDLNVLFISDIRSVGTDVSDNDMEYAAGIIRDLKTQEDWFNTINPHKALLKFRFPYIDGETEYLDGDIYFQAWSPVSSTETRLIPHGKGITKMYNHKKYEEQLCYYNNNVRIALYPHNVKSKYIGNKGYEHNSYLDNCYDCKAEIEILGNYLKRYNVSQLSAQYINDFSRQISHKISKNRTLGSKNINPEEKKVSLSA